MKRIRFEVLPDRDGGWSVTRDRVVVAQFDTKRPAVAFAAERGRASWQAAASGGKGDELDSRRRVTPGSHSRLPIAV